MPEETTSPQRGMAQSTGSEGGAAAQPQQKRYSYCSLPMIEPRVFDPSIDENRLELILESSKKWVNGTVLHYHFLDAPASSAGAEEQKKVVRDAFQAWMDVGIGVRFQEAASRDEAEIRIGFLRGDGSWSYIGRDILDIAGSDRTMNFGWDLRGDIDTAIHEIGHTLGFPHEHQNPNAGIVWDEEAVYASLAEPPNRWPREKTFHNIIRKISPDRVQGSNWDADSVMHYQFEAGMILEPVQFRTGLNPAGGLSARDKEWVRTFYPPLSESSVVELKVAQSAPLRLAPGKQADFLFKPQTSRNYEMRTFGASDTVMVLFERQNGNDRYVGGDDDSGEDRNAYLKKRLTAGKTYVIRVRLYYADREGETALMLW
jgi:hypothetical protein